MVPLPLSSKCAVLAMDGCFADSGSLRTTLLTTENLPGIRFFHRGPSACRQTETLASSAIQNISFSHSAIGQSQTSLMNPLTWNDLFVDASLLDFNALISAWPGLEVGEIRPIGASAFGDLFFERRSGEVMKLDVLEGGVHRLLLTSSNLAS